MERRPNATNIMQRRLRVAGDTTTACSSELSISCTGYTTLGGGKTTHYNLPPYFDDVRDGSWSSEVQPYFPFHEFVGSSDMAVCPLTNQTHATFKTGANACIIDDANHSEVVCPCRHCLHDGSVFRQLGMPCGIACVIPPPHPLPMSPCFMLAPHVPPS
jgi:hypothetical protein